MKICVTENVWEAASGRIASIAPDVEVIRLSHEGEFSGDAAGAEAFFFSSDLYQARRAAVEAAMAVATSGQLKWVHSSAAGVDHPIFQQIMDAGATLTHSPGLHGKPIAQYVIGYMLRHAKRMAAHAEAQARHDWTREIESVELTRRTLGIVGYGGIGSEIARLATAFEMRVVGSKRTPIEDPNLDELLGPDQLHELLAQSDYVALACPLTDETRGLIGAAEFAVMKDDAVLINIARGGVVDEEALIAAMNGGQIAGAVLDVVGEEPLPAESPLWDLPNVVITPHDSGSTDLGLSRAIDEWLKNLARYVRGEELLHVAAGTGVTAG